LSKNVWQNKQEGYDETVQSVDDMETHT